MGAIIGGLQEAEIAVFDKAYVVFEHLFSMSERGVFGVTRAKDNMAYRTCKKLIKKPQGNIIKDEEILLSKGKSRNAYPQRLRLVVADLEIDGKLVRMSFITNNFDWAASSVCDLYRSRWGIEVFFKQIKQTLKVCDFLGHSKQAIRCQLWSALLLYVWLRFQAWQSAWPHSFTRIFTLIRALLWDRFDLKELLEFYGTAGSKIRMCAHLETLYLRGFKPNTCGTA